MNDIKKSVARAVPVMPLRASSMPCEKLMRPMFSTSNRSTLPACTEWSEGVHIVALLGMERRGAHCGAARNGANGCTLWPCSEWSEGVHIVALLGMERRGTRAD